ncbi:MAG: hypothetical protein KF861_02620 [Planctomycetaceae bacterium]|nr:hypothetical protein [Planctomycetaceae bacterium]
MAARVGLPVIITVFVATSLCAAKDRVVVQPRENASPLVLACEIVDYTAEKISLHVNTQSTVHEFPAEQVQSVEAVQTESHRRGVERFQAGDLSEAESLLVQALADEPRAWMQREIRGWLVRGALRRGDRAEAGRRFLEIIEQERAPREYPLIPLVWGTAETGTALRQQAREWLTGELEVGRLMGASILLLDNAYGEVTRTELRRLARSTDRRVSALARAQLWRLRVTATDVTANELAEWEREIESMPRAVRAGPYWVLGRALFQRSEYDRSAASMLWVTTVYAENEPLTAQATWEAANALERLGRSEDARSLLREIVTRFGWSPAAAQARLRLEQMPQSKDVDRDG